MDANVITKFNQIIVGQAEQIYDMRVENMQLRAGVGQLQAQLKTMAQELAALKEQKTDGSVSGKPPITHAQSIADLHGLPRPAADVTAEQFMRDNNIAQPPAANDAVRVEEPALA